MLLNIILFAQTLQEEFDQNTHRLQYIDRAAAYLLQKSEGNDAVQIEHDLDVFNHLVEKVLLHFNVLHGQKPTSVPAITGKVCLTSISIFFLFY